MPEEKRKINAWIPVTLYNKLESAGYDNITQALIKALESFREDTQEDITGYIHDIEGYKKDIEGYKKDIAGYKQDIAALTFENDKLKEDIAGYNRIQEEYKQDTLRIQAGYKEDINRIQKDLDKKNQDIIGYTQDIKALNNEIQRLKEDLIRAPDLVTFAQLQAKYEGLQEIIKEKEKSIERLENDLMKAGQREEDLKQLHNNYFLQIQTLINQKAIGRPKEANRKKQEVSGSKQEENRKFQEASRPAQKEGKGQIEKICKYCEKPFYTDNIQKEYCCKDHKDEAYNEKRRKERQENKKNIV